MAITQLKTGAIADDAVTTAKLAAGTDGQIITYDASGNPTAVGPGTDGQVLTSTGAGSPPAFETPAPGVGGATGVDFNDNVKIRSGTGNDLQIYHDGSHSYIQDSGTGRLILTSSQFDILNAADNEYMARFIQDGAVELYHNNSKKFETTSAGINLSGTAHTITGDFYPSNHDSNRCGVSNRSWSEMNAHEVYVREFASFNDNIKAKFGTGDDLQIYHDGTTNLIITDGPNIRIGTTGETFALFKNNNAVELYYDNSKKLETTSGGAKVSGDLDVVGHAFPNANNTYDLGTSGNRWRNVYTNDLHLSNEGHSNDVDGTWGNWTIQEGESDLFLKNNRSGKKYKFNLTEVS